jgi:hypothetical protein
MIARVGHIVKRVFKPGQTGRLLLLVSVLILILMLFGGAGVIAQDAKPDNAVGFYVVDGNLKWIIPGHGIAVTSLNGLTLSDIEKFYPMTPSQEAGIVHSIPPGPVIIDGVRYAGDQISLFNGKRLRFIVDKDNNLYAFTSVQEFEQLQLQMKQPSLQSLDVYSFFFRDGYYTGNYFGLIPGNGITDLSQIGMDKAISSTKINTSTQWAYLFAYTNYGGDYFGMSPGSTYPWLANQGWNDRASSVWINQ